MKAKKDYWPTKKSNITTSPFISVHKTRGFQPWFDPKRDEYDTDVIQNKYKNIWPFAQKRNVFIDKKKQ